MSATPIDSAFVKGCLVLPSEQTYIPQQIAETALLTDILTVLSLLIFIIMARSIVEIFPSLIGSIIRWKESVNLFTSVKLDRSRSRIALSLILPFCLICNKTELYAPDFISNLGKDARLGVIVAVFLIYIGFRLFLEKTFIPKKRNIQMYKCACRSSHAFFSLLTLLMMICLGFTEAFGVDPESTRIAMLWISAVIYGIFILRKTQIFASSYSFFAAFLYLCGLEILPTGVLVASAVIL